MVNYLAYTSKGGNHTKNEDRIFVNDDVISEGCLSASRDTDIIAGICDGVGSTKGGSFAAEIVASSFEKWDVSKTSALSISRHIHKINDKILLEQKSNLKMNNMATTLAGVVIYKDRYLIFNLGDTRIYTVSSNGELSLKTRDHILSNSNMCVGTTKDNTSEDALVGYLGGEDFSCSPSICKGVFSEKVSTVFICSDGIYKSIPENKLKNIIANTKPLENKQKAILQLLHQNGFVDDISFVILDYVA